MAVLDIGGEEEDIEVGNYFSIDPEDAVIINGVFDDMLEEFGKPCKLTYLTTETICPNCIVNPRTGISTNRYKTGGPIPFDIGDICPVCEGRGKIAGTATFDIITMTIDWEPKPWMTLAAGTTPNVVRIPGGMVVSRGYIKDLLKVLRSDTATLDITSQYLKNEFKLYGEPYVLGAITKDRYFIAIWQRTE